MDAKSRTADTAAMNGFGAGTERFLPSVRCMYERAHLFCDVLAVLVEDLFQLGREAIALSLLDYASAELSPMLASGAQNVAAAVEHRSSPDSGPAPDGDPATLGGEIAARARDLLPMLRQVMAGLDQVARSRLPSDPVEFVVEVTRFIEALKSHLQWQERLLERADPNGLGDGALDPTRPVQHGRSALPPG
jgi:hypothetical protein